VGLGEAALVPAAASLIIDIFPPRARGTALGVFTLGAVFGTGVAMFIGGVLLQLIEADRFAAWPWIGDQMAWRQLMFLAGLPGFALLVLVMLIREPARQHSSGLMPVAQVFHELIRDNGAVLRVCLVKAALAIGDYGLISWMPTLLKRNYALSPLELGGILALAVSVSGALASVAGGAVSDWVVRRHGVRSRVVLLLGCYTITVVGGIAVLLATSSQTVALALALWVFGSVSGYVIGHAVMQEWVPNEMRATTIAISVASTALIGIGLGPTLVALMSAHVLTGAHALQSAMGTVGVMAALLAVLVIRPAVLARNRGSP
jgi:MFS family permease